MKDKVEYKYISFVFLEQKPKTQVWMCINNSGQYELGIVQWNTAWRQYCFFATVQAVYSKGCLEDINNFIERLEKARDGKKYKSNIVVETVKHLAKSYKE